MSARYPHRELRPAAGQRLNLETTADCLRTFSHRHHAESALRLVRGIFHAIEADSVVLHRHHAFAVRMIERNFDVLSAGVLCDVVERFLGDAKERNFHFKCRSQGGFDAAYCNRDPSPPREVALALKCRTGLAQAVCARAQDSRAPLQRSSEAAARTPVARPSSSWRVPSGHSTRYSMSRGPPSASSGACRALAYSRSSG